MASVEDDLRSSLIRLTKASIISVKVKLLLLISLRPLIGHAALLAKVQSYGVGAPFVGWPSNFLIHRSIRVVIDDVNSNVHQLYEGVPQGSELSPTLFLIFINDLLSLTINPIFSFADDSTLCHSFSFCKRPSSLELSAKRLEMSVCLNNDLACITDWGLANRVSFNTKKPQYCCLTHRETDRSPCLTLDNVDVAESGTLELLGMNISADMRWNTHILKIAKDASKCLGF